MILRILSMSEADKLRSQNLVVRSMKMETIVTDAEKNLISFAGTRSSRSSEVVSDAHALEMRRACEIAWFEQIGVAPDTMKLYGDGRTGSPTGSKFRHELDDFVEDFGPIDV